MAALKPIPSGEIQPAIKPLEVEEAEAAKDWPGPQLGPTSWIERGQIWSLELQPYDAKTPPVSDLEGSAEGAEHLKAQRQSEEGEGSPLAQRQTQETFTSDGGGGPPTLKPSVDQDSTTKRWYACDRCDKEFQGLSHLNRHKKSHPGRNTSRQSRRWGQNQAAVSSPDLLAPVSGPRQNLLADGNKRDPQNSGKGSNQAKRTKRLLLCTWCGKDFRWPSHLAQHYRIKCYINKIRRRRKLPKEGSQSSMPPEPAPVEVTKITADAGETGQQKLAPTTDQAPSVSSLCICEQCGQGFQGLSDLSQHQRTHSRRKTVRPNVCQLESCCPRATVPTVQHGEKGVAKSCKMPSQTSKRAPCTKDLHLYDQRKEDIQLPSARAHHCQNMCSAGKAIRSNQDQVGEDKLSLEKPVPLPRKVKTVFADASETLGQKSELTIGPITHSKDLLLCELCGKGFRYPSLLARHQQGHYGKEQASQHQYHSNGVSPDPWKHRPTPLPAADLAPNSHQGSSPKSQLASSQSTFSKKPHVCDHCGKSFRYPSDLARHKPTHSRRNKHSKTPSSRSSATEEYTKVPSTYLCDECGRHFQFLSDFTEHVYTHSVERPYSCAICGCQFKRHVQLKKHERWHEMSEEENDDDDDDNEDVVVMKEEEDDEVVEVKVGDEQTSQGGPEEHVPRENTLTKQPQRSPMGSRVHSNPFDNLGGCECNLCHQGKSRRSELCPPNSVWEIGVSGLPRLLSLSQTCECGYCESGDGSSDPLLNTASPFSRGILGRKELASAQCSCESATDRPAIQNSSGADRVASTLREKVAEDKPYACPKCFQSFSQPSYLTKHLLVHSTTKPYQCATCKKRFARRSYLYKHRRVHVVKLPHECPVCGNYFSQTSYLRKHMRIHAQARTPAQKGETDSMGLTSWARPDNG